MAWTGEGERREEERRRETDRESETEREREGRGVETGREAQRLDVHDVMSIRLKTFDGKPYIKLFSYLSVLV